MKQVIQIFALTLILISVGCGQPAENYTLETLADGREIKLKSVEKVSLSEVTSSLVLDYITDIPLDDAAAVESEATAIWVVFQDSVADAGLNSGMIRAYEASPSAFATSNRSIAFVWVRSAEGGWKRME